MLVKVRYIRLDIQQRRSIDNVHIFNVKDIPLDAQQFHNGQPNRVGTFWSSGSEYSAWLGIQEWRDDKLRVLNSVEVVEQNHVGKALQVFQTVSKFSENLNGALNLGSSCGLDGHTLDIFERAMDYANWLIVYSHLSSIRGF